MPRHDAGLRDRFCCGRDRNESTHTHPVYTFSYAHAPLTHKGAAYVHEHARVVLALVSTVLGRTVRSMQSPHPFDAVTPQWPCVLLVT